MAGSGGGKIATGVEETIATSPTIVLIENVGRR